jgi:hypothetical protein
MVLVAPWTEHYFGLQSMTILVYPAVAASMSGVRIYLFLFTVHYNVH